MIFEADPKQIEELDSKELVRLMHLLLLAECRLAQISLRAAHVPLQITVSDGGEDGRVEWTDGAASTLYFPNRLCIFQSKAQNLTETLVKKEILKKRPKTARSKGKRRAKSKAKRLKQTSMVLSGRSRCFRCGPQAGKARSLRDLYSAITRPRCFVAAI